MRFILIGHYSPDDQESMLRFAQMLYSGFRDAGHDCEMWQPTIRFGSFFRNAKSGVAQWLAHIVKWILFPLELSWRAIRGALGYKDAYCTASFTGKILQKWLLRSLHRATLAAATRLTLSQLQRNVNQAT